MSNYRGYASLKENLVEPFRQTDLFDTFWRSVWSNWKNLKGLKKIQNYTEQVIYLPQSQLLSLKDKARRSNTLVKDKKYIFLAKLLAIGQQLL